MLHDDFYFELPDDILVGSEAGCDWQYPACSAMPVCVPRAHTDAGVPTEKNHVI